VPFHKRVAIENAAGKLLYVVIRNASYWIEHLRLEPHPEGGWYRQTYRADLLLPKQALPEKFKGSRAASTAIYFLLERDDFSAFHRLQSDELWHHYAGDPVLVHIIDPEGHYSQIKLGSDPESRQTFQGAVKAGSWFASHLEEAVQDKHEDPFALVGCTVAPGFDFEDFELAKRDELVRNYPQHQKLINRLTRR
jgi:predicted cupin superfamily sugar epimerase